MQAGTSGQKHTISPYIVFVDCGEIEDANTDNGIISAQLPTGGRKRDLRKLVKEFNSCRLSPYCRGKIRDAQCLFDMGLRK